METGANQDKKDPRKGDELDPEPTFDGPMKFEEESLSFTYPVPT